MAGSILSTYMMFLPEKTKWFCLIGLCIFVFGIYIPYEEHKKKKKQAQKRERKPPQKPNRTASIKAGNQKKLEQLKTLKTAGIISEEEYQEKKRELRQQ